MKGAPIAIYEIDFDGSKFRSVNSAVSQMLGYSEEELFAMNPLDLLVGESKKKFQYIIKEALLGKKTLFSAELEVRAKNGQIIWGLFHARLNLKNGIPETVLVFAQDITETKKSEKECKEAQERFRSLVESTSDWIWEVNQNAVYTYVSPKVKDILGYESAEVLGNKPFDLMPKEEAEKIVVKFQEIAEQKTPFYGLENWNVHKNGTLVLLETSGVPILDAEGCLLGFRGIDRDITERKKVEAALEENKERLQRILNAMEDGIVIIGLDGKVVDCNEAASKQLGFAREELVGKNITDYMVPEDRQHSIIEASAEIRRGGRTLVEARVSRKNGSVFSAEVSLTAFYDKNRKPIGLLGVARDITERKKIEETLRESEQLYRTLFENSEDGFMLLEPIFDKNGEACDFRFLKLNRSYERQTDAKADDVLGKLASEVTPELESEITIISGDVVKKRKAIHNEAHNKYSNKWFDSHYFPYSDGKVGILFRDITERKKAEEALKKSESKFQNLFEQSPTVYEIYDKDGLLIKANSAWEKLWGFPRTVSVGKWNILESEQIAKTGIQPFVKRAYLGETVIVPEKEFDSSLEARSHREGSKRLLNSIIYPIRNESGEVTNIVIMHEDVTVEKILRKQLEEKERMATIGQTAGMIGHDIRNPLQAIIGELFLAKEVMSQAPEGKDKQEALESLNFVQSQVDYINKIVSDLQDYARPLNPEYVIADLSDLIANVFETVGLPDNIKLEVDVKGTLKLKTDATFIKRAMTNLVNNAIQAMPDGGELKVTVHEKEDSQVVSVSDTGKGIPENVKADLFKPLVTTKAKGQGLGLAVVKRLVEALNGKVTVESEVGKGTKFTIILPTKQPEKIL